MKIVASGLQFQSSHSASVQSERRERLRMWVGAPPESGGNREPRPPAPPADSAKVSISAEGSAKQSEAYSAISDAADAVENDPRLLLLRLMIEALTGRAVRVLRSGDISVQAEQAAPPPDLRAPAATAPPAPPATRPNFGIEYDRHDSYSETETTRFQAQGVVRTADGKEISFALDLQMQRSYREESDISLRLGNAVRKDPLVINFAGPAAQLADQTFSFDLNADGTKEQAHVLARGSGFLAFDRNGDGRINDGRELFGATTGEGFAELAALDADGNGWIDEADAAFTRLSIWTKAADGSEQLATLARSGIGALALAHLATPFELKDAANESLGGVRETGVFLKENGAAGTLQQIDLSV